MLLSWYKNFEFSEVKEKATAAAAAVTSVAANRKAATPTAVIVTTTTCKHRNQPNVNAVYVNKKRFESMKMCWMPVCVLYFFPNFILVRVFFSVRSFLFVSAVHSRFIYYIRLGFHLYWWGLWCSFTRSHSHSISFTWHIHSQCNTMSREIDLIVVLFGVNFLLFYSIFVRWSCARECAAYLNVFFTYITLLYSSFPRLSRSLFNIWAVFFPHFSSHFGCFSLFGSLLVQHFMYTYIMLMM